MIFLTLGLYKDLPFHLPHYLSQFFPFSLTLAQTLFPFHTYKTKGTVRNYKKDVPEKDAIQRNLVVFFLRKHTFNNYMGAGEVADPLGRQRRRWYSGAPWERAP